MIETQFITGINAVREAVESGRSIEKVFLEKDPHNARLFEILKTCRKKNIPISLVHPLKLKAMTPVNCQGVLAKASVRDYMPFDRLLELARKSGTQPLFVVAAGVEDPHNLGAIIRTALCVGAHGLILPLSDSAGLSDGTARASAGAVEHLPVSRVSDLPAALKALRSHGLRVVGFEASEGSPLWEADLSGALALVLGGENRGLLPHVRRNLDFIVRIPVAGPVGSLNVSVAGAVALYEAARQRAAHRNPL